jgi:hypothetical protein
MATETHKAVFHPIDEKTGRFVVTSGGERQVRVMVVIPYALWKEIYDSAQEENMLVSHKIAEVLREEFE